MSGINRFSNSVNHSIKLRLLWTLKSRLWHLKLLPNQQQEGCFRHFFQDHSSTSKKSSLSRPLWQNSTSSHCELLPHLLPLWWPQLNWTNAGDGWNFGTRSFPPHAASLSITSAVLLVQLEFGIYHAASCKQQDRSICTDGVLLMSLCTQLCALVLWESVAVLKFPADGEGKGHQLSTCSLPSFYYLSILFHLSALFFTFISSYFQLWWTWNCDLWRC